jgi:hypothetical protein
MLTDSEDSSFSVFVALSTAKLKEWLASDLSGLDLLVIQIDGLHVGDHVLVVAIGIDGAEKHVLALAVGATENAAEVKALLADLVERGLQSEIARLFIVDGAKALSRAVRDNSVASRSSSAARCTRGAISSSSSTCRYTPGSRRCCVRPGTARLPSRPSGFSEAWRVDSIMTRRASRLRSTKAWTKCSPSSALACPTRCDARSAAPTLSRA